MVEDQKPQTENDQSVVQDERERARSKERSQAPPEPEVALGSGSYGEVWLAMQRNIKFFSRFKRLDWPLFK